MTMPRAPKTLREAVAGSPGLLIAQRSQTFARTGASLLGDVPPGAHVLLRTRDQMPAAMALIALDGVAGRIVICPPDVKPDHLSSVIDRAALDLVVSDDVALAVDGVPFVLIGDAGPARGAAGIETQWVLFTSGTTGAPKMVAHTLAGLTGAIAPGAAGDVVWGTFYDIRRYGGLQILLRALLGHASLILSDAHEDVADFLVRLAANHVTHLTGTPSHWRRALMSPANAQVNPRYVRLSGETADQAILDSLKTRFPGVPVGHAYASTEAGVGFEVTDGLEGFPASYLDRDGPVQMKIENGTLHIRSPRAASQYVGGEQALVQDGWVDTTDMIEQRGARCFFVGRTGGIINVGGLKINPEEVEAVINRHADVRASRVFGRKNPITGAIVIAEIVSANDNATLKDEILALCRELLPAHKVPAMLRFVPALELTAGGKLSRHG